MSRYLESAEFINWVETVSRYDQEMASLIHDRPSVRMFMAMAFDAGMEAGLASGPKAADVSVRAALRRANLDMDDFQMAMKDMWPCGHERARGATRCWACEQHCDDEDKPKPRTTLRWWQRVF